MDLERSKDNLTNDNSLRKIKENEEIKPLVDDLRRELISSFVSILNEHKISQGDFEGFAVIDAEYSDQKHLLLSYLANQDYEIDEKIKRSSLAVSMLKKYFDGFLMSRIEKSGLILRANDLIKKNVGSKEIINILNNEFSEKLLKEFEFTNQKFCEVQDEIVDLVNRRSIHPDNWERDIAGITYRALKRYDKSNKTNIAVANDFEGNRIDDEKNLLFQQMNLLDEIKGKSIFWVKTLLSKKDSTESYDWVKISHLLYLSRLKMMNMQGRKSVERIFEDGYFSVLVEILTGAYQAYLKKNYSLEKKYESFRFSIQKADEIFENVFTKNDPMLFQKERGEFLKYKDEYINFEENLVDIDDKIAQLRESILSFSREKITRVAGNNSQEIQNLIVVLNEGIEKSDLSFFAKEINDRYVFKGEFLRNNIGEIEFVDKKLSYLNYLINKRVNFFNLKAILSDFKTDYVGLARDVSFNKSSTKGLETKDLIHGLFFMFEFAFVCRMCEFLEDLEKIDLFVMDDKISAKYFSDAVKIRDRVLQNMKFSSKDLNDFIGCLNIICRDLIEYNAIGEGKIVPINQKMFGIKKNILSNIDNFRDDLKKLKEIFR